MAPHTNFIALRVVPPSPRSLFGDVSSLSSRVTLIQRSLSVSQSTTPHSQDTLSLASSGGCGEVFGGSPVIMGGRSIFETLKEVSVDDRNLENKFE